MTAILGDNLVRTAPLELPESYKSIQTCQVPVYPTLMALTGSRSKTSRVLYETFAQIQYNVAVKRTTGYWIKFSDMGGLVSARMDWSNALILPVVQVMLVGIILASAVFVARDKEHYNSRFQATLSSYIARSSLTKICLFQAIIFMFMYDEVLSGVFFGGEHFHLPLIIRAEVAALVVVVLLLGFKVAQSQVCGVTVTTTRTEIVLTLFQIIAFVVPTILIASGSVLPINWFVDLVIGDAARSVAYTISLATYILIILALDYLGFIAVYRMRKGNQ